MLVEVRDESGLKQKHIADALGWNQSVVSKIETKQRRIDVVELIRVAEIVGFDPALLVRRLQKMIKSQHLG
ncbi:MAG: helix-turn-helix transcriptional regulator [Hyphomonadaceae bacterium]|nr:helix-turn-helix transcriptional regulator [Hyphomonadaceae bacterium]